MFPNFLRPSRVVRRDGAVGWGLPPLPEPFPDFKEVKGVEGIINLKVFDFCCLTLFFFPSPKTLVKNHVKNHVDGVSRGVRPFLKVLNVFKHVFKGVKGVEGFIVLEVFDVFVMVFYGFFVEAG